jgi:hypothetical protein
LSLHALAADRLRTLTADSTYVPAFLMAAQVLARRGQEADACAILRKGVAAAQRQGNAHAASEMKGLLDSFGMTKQPRMARIIGIIRAHPCHP